MYRFKIFCATVWVAVLFASCNFTGNQDDKGKKESVAPAEVSAPAPSFVVGVTPATKPGQVPGLQSFVWARQGNKLLLFGGRIEGFHGLTGDIKTFSSRKANSSVFVIDISNFSYSELKLDTTNSGLLQFFSSNMEFCQNADTLFVTGGYGKKKLADDRSDYTFDRMFAISVSSLIKQVEAGDNNIQKSFLASANSPFVQVTGGELVKQGKSFYLIGGQNFDRLYDRGQTGRYTSAVRKFSFSNGVITDTSSVVDTAVLHRRDMAASEIITNTGMMYAIFGGVFSSNDDGYQNPVIIIPSANTATVKQSPLLQKTSQYDCAIVTVYDSLSNSTNNTLLGGIGKYQYHENTGKWEDGDMGAKLPFVKTITQMIYSNQNISENVQLPPNSPALPALLGANAIFIPYTNFIYQRNVLDYSKITADSTVIGIMYGGIKSQQPTSSEIYPTSLNNVVYYVYLKKMK